MRRLKNRSEFLKAARGQRVGRAAFSLQANALDLAEPGLGPVDPGIGFTVTKQMGNSPQRNRIRRRLRAAAKACASGFEPQHDYVLVGRREALSIPYGQLVTDLAAAISKIHLKKKS
ncbi:ribonuclease P protein component [Devosia sp.]|uniref:ribonuclease P protein component n=1 Tax=Devosia sp. TaxID=1871048 RepID=UPI003F723897